MKGSILLLSVLLGPLTPAFASPLGDQIKATLLDHVSTTALIQNGQTDIALLDSVIQVGQTKGNYIAGLQIGFAGDTKPEPGDTSGADFLAGGTLRLNVLIKDVLNFAPHWEFLRSLEYGPGYHYNFREKEGELTFSVGLAFDPAPKQ